MGATPTTRPSLLLRIRDCRDHEAWGQFVALYGPLVYQFARRRGLQDADAADVTQIVFHAVSQQISRLDYDPQRGSFRGWLLVVTRNQINKFLERAWARGRSPSCEPTEHLAEVCAPENREAQVWEEEFRLRAFRLAADRVQREFESSSWQAFWQTAVQGQAAKAVGERLGMSVGAVYTARSRILSRIKAAITEFDDEDVRLLES
jgi:RNA polymerase sigma factor (sigma-70 family)